MWEIIQILVSGNFSGRPNFGFGTECEIGLAVSVWLVSVSVRCYDLMPECMMSECLNVCLMSESDAFTGNKFRFWPKLRETDSVDLYRVLFKTVR